ncbi:MAG: hypothetical protein FWF52_09925 [Candidatus Azobacteroides sp.]|nr:hypothetical protein [Candidatus Azobacteroides sp.]
METKKMRKSATPDDKYAVAVDEYMRAILCCKNVERKINYLINLGGLCCDCEQHFYANKVYKKALEICLENETGMFPRFKNQALMVARNIQGTGKNASTECEEQTKKFYEQRFQP